MCQASWMSTRLTYERKKERKEERKRKEGKRKGGGGREGEALAPVALVVPRALNILGTSAPSTQHTVYPHKNKNYSYGQYGHAHQILDSGDHYCDLGAPYPNPNPNPNPNPKSNPNPKPNLG